MGNESGRSLARSYPRQSRGIVLLLFVALLLFVGGIFRPFTQVTKLWIFDNQISVYAGLITLWKEREIFLFLILFVFTVIFPLMKILSLLALWLKRGLTQRRLEQLHHFVSHLGKWSMLDVLIVAILVLTLKSGGGLASIKIQDGLFLFFASVTMTQIASIWTGRVARRQLGNAA